jgi:Polyketide cyclase / dehydrase and lipid transport
VLLTLAASGDQSVAVVWERYEELDLWPTWSPYLRRAEPVGVRLRAGLTGRVFGPLGVRAHFTVRSVEPALRRWAWTVCVGPVAVRLRHGVDEAGFGSRAWLVLDGPSLVVLGYAPLARWALHRLVTLPAN